MPTVARNVGGPPGRIIYTESHDTAGDLNGGVRLPTAIHSADPAGYYARKRSALGAVLVMSSPGTPMLLQGQELLETNSFSDTRAMDWTRTNSQVGTLRLYRDLTLALQHPDGSEVTLVTRRGGSSDNYGSGTGACETMTYTVFDQSAATLIRNGSAPFAGTYRPEGSLNAFNGKPLNGTWRLRMRDSYANNVGTALCWGLRATYEQRTSACTTFSNHPPVAHSTNLWLSLSAPTNFQLGGSDVDGQSVSFEARTTPVHGLFTLLSATNGQSSYTPIHGYSGTDSFDFVAVDGLATSTVATVTLVLTPPTDTNTNGMPDAWEETHFTNLTSALPEDDSDGDGVPNRIEYLAHTNPQDSNSVLRLTQLQLTSGWYALGWKTVGGTRYSLEFSALLDPPQFQAVTRPLAQEVEPAAYGATSSMYFVDDFTLTPPPDTNALRVYRVRVLNE